MKRRSHSKPGPPLRGALLCGLVALLAISLITAVAATAAPKIAVTRGDHVWTVAANGGELRRLTSGANQEYGPAWAHDRGTIAYLRSSGTGENRQVWLMHSDGSSQRRLAYSGPSLSSGTRALAYSADGRFLAGGCEILPNPTGTEWAVTVLDLRTYKSRILCRFASQGGVASLSWSPDGSRLAASVEYGAGAGLLMFDVARGRQIETHEGNHGTLSVSWRPDGKYLLTSVFHGPGTPVWGYLMKTDGSLIKRLGRDQNEPAYSPDGKHYAFVVRGKWGYPCTLKCADADGSDVTTIFKSSGKEYVGAPAWR